MSGDELSDSKLRRLDRALAADARAHNPAMPDSYGTPAAVRGELSAADRARQGSFRRYVVASVGVAALIALIFIIKGAVSEPPVRATKQTASTAARAVKKATASPSTTAKATVDTPRDVEPVNQASFEHLSDDELTQRTLDLLNDRDFEAAEQAARALVDRHPQDAFGYRCLGAALQDQLRATEAREVYSQCVQTATFGDVYECGALGGRGK